MGLMPACTLALASIISTFTYAVTPPQPPLPMLPGANAVISDLDFKYRISGEPSLRPLRVYNNSITTTIELPNTLDGKTPKLQIEGTGKYLNSTVTYSKNPDRLIVDGLFDSAELVYSGAKKGTITIDRLIKTGTGSKGLILPPLKPELLGNVQQQSVSNEPVQNPVRQRPNIATAIPPVSIPATVQAEGFNKTVSTTSTAVTAPIKPSAPPVPTWTVSPKDRTIREALKNWSLVAGWTFEPEYWTLPIDIPVTASAHFSGDFKTAVRQLIAATELSDTPSQPCFYLNRVVRVVPINQVCDQMSAR
ncbi:TcpQ domain-containing protein [Pseudomonas helleri]|uniref:TcpQ domain-containing protein n=1 Tax=Pseudomonas helleri TaxID=1608996 RepID=UPI003FD4ABB2